MVQPRPQRCSLNAPGPFYTTGQCLACETPEVEASDLLAPLTDGNYTTYFVRQPQTPEEVERACNAIGVCCVMDLRYGGVDRAIIERLGNDPVACDYVIREGQLVRSEKAPAAELLSWPTDLKKTKILGRAERFFRHVSVWVRSAAESAMKTILFGFLLLTFAVIFLSSPYWLFREITRPTGEPLPDWMGDARSRKKRLVVVVGVLAIVAGGVAIAAGLAE